MSQIINNKNEKYFSSNIFSSNNEVEINAIANIPDNINAHFSIELLNKDTYRLLFSSFSTSKVNIFLIHYASQF